MNIRFNAFPFYSQMNSFFLISLPFVWGTISCNSSEDGQSAIEDASSAHEDGATAETGRIYVAIAGGDEIAVIDEEKQEVVDSIPTGVGPAILLATPDHTKLYTANWTDNTVSAVVVATAETKHVELPGRPYVIAMAKDGKYLYAGLSNNQIAVLNLKTDEVERFISTPDMPASIIVSSDSKTLYVAELMTNTLRALSAETGEIVHEPIEVGFAPAWITITPDGSRVYTLNYLSDDTTGDITVVNTETFTVETSIKTGEESKGIIGNVTPDGSMLYVTNLGSGDFIAINTHSNEIVKRIELDGRPVGVNFSQDGKRVYITDYGVGSLDSPTSAGQEFLTTGVFTPIRDGQVSIFDTGTDKLIGKKIRVGPGPSSIVAFSRQ